MQEWRGSWTLQSQNRLSYIARSHSPAPWSTTKKLPQLFLTGRSGFITVTMLWVWDSGLTDTRKVVNDTKHFNICVLPAEDHVLISWLDDLRPTWEGCLNLADITDSSDAVFCKESFIWASVADTKKGWGLTGCFSPFIHSLCFSLLLLNLFLHFHCFFSIDSS